MKHKLDYEDEDDRDFYSVKFYIGHSDESKITDIAHCTGQIGVMATDIVSAYNIAKREVGKLGGCDVFDVERIMRCDINENV